MALAYSQFGLASPVLYAAYLRTHYDGDCSESDIVVEGVSVGTERSADCESGGDGSRELVVLGNAEAVFASRALRVGGERWSNRFSECERPHGVGIGQASFALHGGVVFGESGESGVAGEVFAADASVGGGDTRIGIGRSENGVVRGKWYKKNKARKSKLKDRRSSNCGFGSGLGSSDEDTKGSKVDCSLQASLREKWQAENELRKFEAERRLRLLKEQDEIALVKMQRAQVMRTTETCKVQTEKAFASLKRSGDVVGFAETVVSDPSLTEGSSARSSGDCISPDSSVSQQEIRQMQKDILEFAKEKEDAKRYMEKVKQTDMKVHLHALRIAGEKTAYTVDTEGEIAIDADGDLGEDGKVHVALGSRVLPNPCYKQKYRESEECDW